MPTCLIVGAGPGLSAALARRFAADGETVALAARRVDKLADLTAEIGAHAFACDASRAEDVTAGRSSTWNPTMWPNPCRSRPSALSWSPSRRPGAC